MGVDESSAGSSKGYENEIRAMRTENAFFTSPEIRQIMEEAHIGAGGLTVVEVSPSDTAAEFITDPAEIEWTNQMHVSWQERMQLLFHNPSLDQPSPQPLPLWSEVPPAQLFL